jgi:glycosyltransferase involved in cell wall biosynthesis
MELSNLLSIVIPCKNEGYVIDMLLDILNSQKGIEDVDVIISDSSDDGITRELLEERIHDKFNLYVITGGLPSLARNNGMSLVTTPYVLFMDSDMFMLDTDLLDDSVKLIHSQDLDLVTCKVRSTTGEYNYVYRVFDIIQKISKIVSPFCLGGFMLFRVDTFKKLGGFDESIKVAEDYMLSKKIKRDKFKIHKSIVFTSPRRFQTKGLWYMLKLMIGSFFNKNNKKYFEEDKDYWI